MMLIAQLVTSVGDVCLYVYDCVTDYKSCIIIHMIIQVFSVIFIEVTLHETVISLAAKWSWQVVN